MKTREGDGFLDRRLAQEMPMFVVTAVKPDGRHVVYLTARSGIQSPWIAPNEIGTGRQIVNGFVASELSVGVSPHTRSVVLSTIDERGSPTRRMRDSLSPFDERIGGRFGDGLSLATRRKNAS